MDFFTILSFILMTLLYVVPFIFVYFFAKRLERYFHIRSFLFFSGSVCAVLSFSLLTIDSVINPLSIELGSGVYLSSINLAGAFFSLAASILFYLLTDEVSRTLGAQERDVALPILFLVILFALYYALSKAALSLSLNFFFSIASFLFLFLSYQNLAEIYGSLASGYRTPALIASFLLLWHVFYQTFAFMLYLFPSEISGTFFYYAQTAITIATILLLAIPVWRMLKSLGITVKQDMSPFLNRISMLIGGSAITILKRAIDEYNREHGTTISYDPEKGLLSADENFMLFAVSYFEGYIGPVAKRVYSDLVSKDGSNSTKTS